MTTARKTIAAGIVIATACALWSIPRGTSSAYAQRPPQTAHLAIITHPFTEGHIDYVFVRVYDAQSHTMCYGFINQNVSCVRVAEVIP